MKNFDYILLLYRLGRLFSRSRLASTKSTQSFLALIGDLHALTPKGRRKRSAVINEADERAESDGGGNDATTMSDGGTDGRGRTVIPIHYTVAPSLRLTRSKCLVRLLTLSN